MKKLGFGLMRLPLLDNNDYGSVDVERVKSMVDQFMENGFTYFDTAAPTTRATVKWRSGRRLLLVQHEPFEKTPTQKIN